MLKMESNNIKQNIINNKMNSGNIHNNNYEHLIKPFDPIHSTFQQYHHHNHHHNQQQHHHHQQQQQQQQQQHNYKINKNPLISKQYPNDKYEEFENNNKNPNQSNIINSNNDINNNKDYDSSDNEEADKMLLNIQQSPLLSNTNTNNIPYPNNHKRKSINMESLSLTSPQQNSFKPTNNTENEVNQQSILNSPLPQLNRISNNLISIVNSINKKNTDDQNNDEESNKNNLNNSNTNIDNNCNNNNNPYDQNNSSPLCHDELSDDEDTNEFEQPNNNLSILSLNSPQLSVSQNGTHLIQDNQNVPNNCSYLRCCICLYGPPPSFYTSAPTWADICYIALYCLTISKPELKYYHIKKDICTFIDCHYETICMRKRTSIWRQTVNMTLSHPQYFEMFQQESALENGRKGYYGLKQIHDPYEHTALNKRSRRKRRHEQKMIQEELKKNGFTNLLLNSPNNNSINPSLYGNNPQPHGFYLSQPQPAHYPHQPPMHVQNHQKAPPTPTHPHHLHSQSPSPMSTPILPHQPTPQMTSNHHHILSSPYLKNNPNKFSPSSTPNHISNNNNNNSDNNNLQQQNNDEVDQYVYNSKKLKQSNSAPLILPIVNQPNTPQFTRAKSCDDIYKSINNEQQNKRHNSRANLSKSGLNLLNNDKNENPYYPSIPFKILDASQRLEDNDDENEREVPTSRLSNRIISQTNNNTSPILNNSYNNNYKQTSNNSRSNSPNSLSPNQYHDDSCSSENESSKWNHSNKNSKLNNLSLSSSTINTMSLMNINSSNSNINTSYGRDNIDEEDDIIFEDYEDDEDDDLDSLDNENGSPKKRLRITTRPNEKKLLEDYYQKHYGSTSKLSKDELVNLSNILRWNQNRIQRWLDNRRTKDKLRNIRGSQDRVISFCATSSNSTYSSSPNSNSPINQSPLVPSNDLNNYKSSVNSLLN